MHIQCNMLFKIFGKIQNCAKTIVRPNGPKQFSIRSAHMIRIVFVSAWGKRQQCKEWEVQKINRENESHWKKNQGLNTPEFHSREKGRDLTLS